jgi:hypothetical protein
VALTGHRSKVNLPTSVPVSSELWDRAGAKKDSIFLCVYICIKQTQNVHVQLCIHFEIHLEIRIFRALSPLLLTVRGAQAPAAPVVPTAMGQTRIRVDKSGQSRIVTGDISSSR